MSENMAGVVLVGVDEESGKEECGIGHDRGVVDIYVG